MKIRSREELDPTGQAASRNYFCSTAVATRIRCYRTTYQGATCLETREQVGIVEPVSQPASPEKRSTGPYDDILDHRTSNTADLSQALPSLAISVVPIVRKLILTGALNQFEPDL